MFVRVVSLLYKHHNLVGENPTLTLVYYGLRSCRVELWHLVINTTTRCHNFTPQKSEPLDYTFTGVVLGLEFRVILSNHKIGVDNGVPQLPQT